MTTANLRDGIYAEWRGHMLPAVPCDRLHVYLRWDRNDEAPDSFELEDGQLWRTTPKAELTQYFELRSYCTWHGEPCFVMGIAKDGRLDLKWQAHAGVQDPTAFGFGRMLEFGDYSAIAAIDEVEGLHQVRQDIPLAHLQ